MNWRVKATIQNLIASLPDQVGSRLYYALQRSVGGLRDTSPLVRLKAGARIGRFIREFDRSLVGATCLEVGTGHQLNLPIALWLQGAERIITVDLNRYLKPQLVMSDLDFIRRNSETVLALFDEKEGAGLVEKKLGRLLAFRGEFPDLLALLGIEYRSPLNAADLQMQALSVDFHLSYTVLEHVRSDDIVAIFREAGQLLRPDGLLIHLIDFSDHFSHSDPRISSINFLRYNEERWFRYAGNKFMYHNRLRLDEFRDLLCKAKLEILAQEASLDKRALRELQNGVELDSRFSSKPAEINAVSHAWIVARTASGSDAQKQFFSRTPSV